MSILQKFYQISGLKINVEKTKAISGINDKWNDQLLIEYGRLSLTVLRLIPPLNIVGMQYNDPAIQRSWYAFERNYITIVEKNRY